MTRPYPQCGIGGLQCTIPDCGPPWCLPDGTYTNDRVKADRARRAVPPNPTQPLNEDLTDVELEHIAEFLRRYNSEQ